LSVLFFFRNKYIVCSFDSNIVARIDRKIFSFTSSFIVMITHGMSYHVRLQNNYLKRNYEILGLDVYLIEENYNGSAAILNPNNQAMAYIMKKIMACLSWIVEKYS